MRDWRDVLPDHEAKMQKSWERGKMIARIYGKDGLTYHKIALRLGVSVERVRQLHVKTIRHSGPSPLEKYLHHGGDIAALAREITRPRRLFMKER